MGTAVGVILLSIGIAAEWDMKEARGQWTEP